MITLFFKRAIDDIFKNRFLNLVTIITISLSILITSAFILFFINTSEIINSWKKGLRIMAYLKDGLSRTEMDYLTQAIRSLDGVEKLRYISKSEALSQLEQEGLVQSTPYNLPSYLLSASHHHLALATNHCLPGIARRATTGPLATAL